MQLSDFVRRPFFIEELHRLTWTGSAKLSSDAREVYHAYVLLKQFGVKPWEINDTGEVYKEDLVNMIALENFVNEAARKWENAGSKWDNAGRA